MAVELSPGGATGEAAVGAAFFPLILFFLLMSVASENASK